MCACALFLQKVAIASDIMVERLVTMRLGDDLNLALSRFTELTVDELPVVDDDDPNRIVGVLRRKEAIAAYTRRGLSCNEKVRGNALSRRTLVRPG